VAAEKHRPQNEKRQLAPPFLIAFRISGRGRLGLGLLAVLLPEFLHASGGIHDFLLAGIERMTGRADFYVQWFTERRTRSEGIPAAAGHRDIGVFRMDFRFHFSSFLMEAGFALPKGADYLQESGDWQPRIQAPLVTCGAACALVPDDLLTPAHAVK
jgi:hypothetical protein